MKSRNRSAHSNRLYIGMDIGGTNIQTSLVEECGIIICREKAATPRDTGPEAVIAQLEKTIEEVLKAASLKIDDLTAIGIAVPGVVDPAADLWQSLLICP